MIIHPRAPKIENGEITLAAQVELEKPPFNLPKLLWWKFPQAQMDFISDRADGFAVALLDLAMQRGEDIRVRGSLSPRLAFGMQEYQRTQSLWHPRQAKPIQICADEYTEAKSNGSKMACAFSGGVDSFFTLWSHLSQNEQYRGNALAYGLFVQGFDIGLQDTAAYETCRAAYDETLREWGVQLFAARTNVRAFDKTGNWVKAAELALIGTAHLLGQQWRRFYVPSSEYYGDFPTSGSDALLNALLSTESLQILNDGARSTKFEKIAAVAYIPETYHRLRVCYKKAEGLTNCCECDKCIQTMVGLALCDALENYATFPKPLTRSKIRRCRILYAMVSNQLNLLNMTHKHRRYDFAFDMSISLGINSLRWGSSWLKKRIGLM